jgi:hypothetical protein
MKTYIKVFFFLIILVPSLGFGQAIKNGKLYLNEDGSHYVKLTLNTQVWMRAGEYNPGSTIFGSPKKGGVDIGIRRYRVQFMSQITDRVFVYSQFGENNFNNIADRKQGFFVHDAMADYAVIPKKLSLGGGLSAWSGLARFASPSVGTIMGIDAPLFQQSTNDVTDLFLRKLSVFAKGKLGKLDYRVAMAQPMAIQKSAGYNATITTNSSFSGLPPKMQWNSYLQYQFKEQESNQTPYMTGTYLGTKKVFNVGAGIVYQAKAMNHIADNLKDTVQTNMLQIAADVFYDAPLKEDGSAISIYANASHFDFGKNYFRNQSVMNPANGTGSGSSLNGSGFGYPAIGTGNVYYTQVGYKTKNNLIGKTSLMPYVSLQVSDLQKLQKPMTFYSAGVNWLLAGHTSKFTVAFENRPIFNNDATQMSRKTNLVMQYQVYLN